MCGAALAGASVLVVRAGAAHDQVNPLDALRGQGAQDTARADTVQAPPPPQPIPASEIARRSQETNQRLREVRSRLTAEPAVEGIAERLPQLIDSLQELHADPASQDPEGLSRRRLGNLRQAWEAYDRRLEGWQTTLANRSDELEGARRTLERLRATWEATAERADSLDLPEATVGQVRSVLQAIEGVRTELRSRLQVVLSLQNRIAEESIRVTEVLERIAAAEGQARGRLLAQDSPPVWRLLLAVEEYEFAGEMGASWQEDRRALRRFLDRGPDRFILHALLFLGLLALVLALRRRGRDLAEEEPALEGTVRLLSRPFSSAFLLALLFTSVIHPAAPPVVLDIARLVALLPVLRLLPALLPRELHRAFYGLAGLYLLSSLQAFTPEGSLLNRTLLLVITALTLAGLVVVLKRSEWVKDSERQRRWRWMMKVARLGLVTLGLAIAANLLGFSALADLLTSATLTSGYIAVVLYAVARVLEGVARLLIRTPALQAVNGVRRNTRLIGRRAVAAVRVLSVLTWIVATLLAFSLLDPLIAGAAAVLETELSVGSLSISLGDVIAFVVALWAALLISRFIRFILDEDVLARIDLPRGVPAAISKLINYGVIALGFFVAIAAAGLQLDRLAIIFGALSVGIGFGLQNIVNNFVSGLILIFERPVQEGDTVQLGDMLGDVKRIGIRSSTVRTIDGAEVIVPNGNLISNEVINWTLSDRHRRIQLDVGVKYGTDPQKVLDVLYRVAKDNPDVHDHPEPQPLFRSFGDSSLNFALRFWTNFENWYQVASDVTVQVNNALKEAGIEIPFPQRDLHVKSVNPSILPLRGAGTDS